jgi:hypothetical protein
MDHIVGGVDVEDAEQHLVIRHSRHKTENADEDENNTEENCSCFDHGKLLCWRSRFEASARRSQAYGDGTPSCRGERRSYSSTA